MQTSSTVDLVELWSTWNWTYTKLLNEKIYILYKHVNTYPTSIGYFENTSSVVSGNFVSMMNPTSLIPPRITSRSMARSAHTLAPIQGVTVNYKQWDVKVHDVLVHTCVDKRLLWKQSSFTPDSICYECSYISLLKVLFVQYSLLRISYVFLSLICITLTISVIINT